MSHPPSPSQQRLTSILRGLRERSGLSTYALGSALGWSQSRVSRIERGEGKAASVEEVQAWADATSADTATHAELAALAEQAWDETRSWRASHRGGLAARQREMGEYEQQATEILQFTPATIPGLLQSPAYARSVMTFGDVTSQGGIDEAVAARMRRQGVLRDEGRRFEYLLTEGALRWNPGPPEVAAEQLAHLLAAAKLPAVSLSVIPFSRRPAGVYLHPFTIYRIPDAPAVLVENYHAESFIAEPGSLAIYERTFAMLLASAVTGDEAAEFMRAVLLG